jgi:hypothetical protein
MTAPLHLRRWPVLLACAAAGGLAVPLDLVATPAAAAVGGVLGLAGLRVWRWSRLPVSNGRGVSGAHGRAVQSAVWFGLGVTVGLVLLGVIRFVVEPAVPAAGARLAVAATVPLWHRLIIIYVAAVSEEVIFRLLLLSLVAGLAARVFRMAGAAPDRRSMWAANVVAALAFGAVHLPSWSAVGPLSAGLAVIVVTLNAVGGLVFGHAFVTRGIVAAMWAHAGADVAMQLIGPLTR